MSLSSVSTWILRTSVPSVFFSSSVLVKIFFPPLWLPVVVLVEVYDVTYGEDVTVVTVVLVLPVPLVTDTPKLLLSRFFSVPVDQSA